MNLKPADKNIPATETNRLRVFFIRYKKQLNHLIQQNPYLLINYIFVFLLVLFFAYFIVFPSHSAYPIGSMAGHNLSSTGLSRAFSEMVRFHVQSAYSFNPYIFGVAIFFGLQLILRLVFITILTKHAIAKNKLLSIDIILSVLLFLCGFGNMVYHQLISIK